MPAAGPSGRDRSVDGPSGATHPIGAGQAGPADGCGHDPVGPATWVAASSGRGWTTGCRRRGLPSPMCRIQLVYRPAPGTIPDSPGVYRFRDPRRPGHLCRQGEEPAAAAELLFRRRRLAAPADRADGHQRRRRRVDGGVHRGRGAAAGIQLDQGVRPAVQRPLPRRQVLPRAGRHHRRGVPAAAGDARPAPQGGPVLRSVRPRLGDPGDPRPAAAGVPRPHLLGRCVPALPADRPALPARLHRQVFGAVHRPGHRRGTPARSSRTSATSWPARPTR